MNSYRRIINGNTKQLKFFVKFIEKRFISSTTNSNSIIQQQNEIFDKEYKKQQENVGRIEKIEIHYKSDTNADETAQILLMNKNISTPYDCAKHLGEKIANTAVVGLINNTNLWHLHKPIPESCELKLLNYQKQPHLVNNIFWRSCSFLLGAILNNAFKDTIKLDLHSFPKPNVKSGSFVYDVHLSLDNWKPTTNELKTLSMEMIKFCRENYRIETLNVQESIALEIFANNCYKYQQIPDIAQNNNGLVTLYRCNGHIDISKGPMIPSTNHLGRISVTNVFKLDNDGPSIYRFQGVALPASIRLDHFGWSLLEERAALFNNARIPGSNEVLTSEDSHNFVTQASG